MFRFRFKIAGIGLLMSVVLCAGVGLTFKDLNGRKVGLRDYRGKAVVLNFWATWCVPCNAEMPMFAEVEKEYAPRGVVFIAASLDDRTTRPKIPDFIAKFNIGFPVWVGASTMDLDDLKLGQGLPATAFLDQEGRIVARALGQLQKDQLKERLDWLIGDRKGPTPNPLIKNLK
jgi:thiol-disulfide isomerase/thioredoxin